MAADKVPYPKVYGFWTNKGGVGKTTLCFHMATTFAELFPEKVVVAIDMCPQSNLSATLLTRTTSNTRRAGDEVVKEMHEANTADSQVPKTIVGRFISRLRGKNVTPAEKLLIAVRDENLNIHVPANIHLVCGHDHLDMLAPALSTRANGAVDQYHNDYVDTHYYLREFIEELAEYFAKEGKEMVMFIDTNPSFSVYTQIALCAMTELVIPVNADTFSLQAVNGMYNLVYGLYPTKVPAAKVFEEQSFAYKAKQYDLHLPVITAIIHNRNPITNNNTQAQPHAFRAMAAEQVDMLFDGYDTAKNQGQLERVFKLPGDSSDGAGELCANKRRFAEAYTAVMRDMRSCGVAAVHSGFPLWKLWTEWNLVDSQFKVAGVKNSIPSCLQDLLESMATVFGSMWHEKDEKADERLQAIVARAGAAAAPAGA